MPIWTRIRSWLADALRGISACLFPFFTWLAWIGILAFGQGEDVVLRAVERAALDRSFAELVALAISSTLLGLSLWYAMRCLLSLQRPGLPPPAPGPNGPAAWLPRLFGASAVAWPGLVVVRAVAWTGTSKDPEIAAIRATAHEARTIFLLLALALLVLLWRRASLAGLGRAGGPAPILTAAAVPGGVLRAVFWALALMALCGVLVLALPLSVTRVVGSAALVALALACLDVVGSFALTFWPLRHGLPALSPWVFALAVLISPLTDNHAPDPRTLAHRAIPAAQRPSIAEAYGAWLARHDPDEPVYVVATEGGGIRAAYWTAAVLERLDAATDRHFARDLFAISSVSGGSVGAGFWVAGQRARACDAGTTRADVATRALTTDFLSPTVGFLLFPDLMQRFVPTPFPEADRSRGLEESWRRALGALPGAPMDRSLAELREPCSPERSEPVVLPELLINATVAETGQRAVLTRLSTRGFVDVFTPRCSSDPSTDHQPLAGVVLQSARFPVVSPAGSVVDMSEPDHPLITRLIDGGYFDNSGIVTALELIAGMRAVPGSPNVVLVVIADSEYGGCTRVVEGDGHTTSLYCASPKRPPADAVVRGPVAGTAWLNEPLPILTGLFDVRDSHVLEAAARALGSVQVAVVDRTAAIDEARDARPHATATATGSEIVPPLGWALSRSVVRQMDDESLAVVRHMPAEPPPWTPPEPPATPVPVSATASASSAPAACGAH